MIAWEVEEGGKRRERKGRSRERTEGVKGEVGRGGTEGRGRSKGKRRKG